MHNEVCLYEEVCYAVHCHWLYGVSCFLWFVARWAFALWIHWRMAGWEHSNHYKNCNLNALPYSAPPARTQFPLRAPPRVAARRRRNQTPCCWGTPSSMP